MSPHPWKPSLSLFSLTPGSTSLPFLTTSIKTTRQPKWRLTWWEWLSVTASAIQRWCVSDAVSLSSITIRAERFPPVSCSMMIFFSPSPFQMLGGYGDFMYQTGMIDELQRQYVVQQTDLGVKLIQQQKWVEAFQVTSARCLFMMMFSIFRVIMFLGSLSRPVESDIRRLNKQRTDWTVSFSFRSLIACWMGTWNRIPPSSKMLQAAPTTSTTWRVR